jgi:hypothetical protein
MNASYYGHFEILRFLMENNADLNIKNDVFFILNISSQRTVYFNQIILYHFFLIYFIFYFLLIIIY